MQKLIMGSVVAFAMTTTSLSAAPVLQPGGFVMPGDQVQLVKNDKDNKGGGKKKIRKGNGKGNGHKAKGKPEKAKGKPEHAGGPGNTKAAAGNPGKDKTKGRRAFSASEREEAVTQFIETRAPDGRDMARPLGAAGLLLATPQLVVSETPEDELIGYVNCPPGLAKKDPPCVPPGLAKKGVTSDQWLAYDAEDYDTLWRERRATVLESEIEPDPDLLLLQSEQIATLFGLVPTSEGQRYALIDGLPVLLDEEDYVALQLVNELAQVPELDDGLRIAPTAALTQAELISLFRLPELGADENYAVVNGQLLRLNDSEYEVLQLIRIARAVL